MQLSTELKRMALENINPSLNDYTKGGLLYCGNCDTPKETKSEWSGECEKPEWIPDTFPIMCKCKNAEYEIRKAEEEKQMKFARIASLKEKYVTDKQYLNMTFDKADKGSGLEWAQKYVEAWEEIKEDENAGLLLYGDTGTGKTFVACCIGNALLENGISVMIANIADLLDKVGGFDGKEVILDKIQKCSLLIIDDFGATRGTEFANEQIYKIIDTRYRAKKPMIITTNLAPNLMLSESDIELKRTYQRVIERCRAIPVNGNNRRLDIAKQSKLKLDSILFGGRNHG